MSRLTQILRGKKIKPLTEMESAVKYAIDNAGGGGSGLPPVTDEDNGKMLTVDNGEWGASSFGIHTYAATASMSQDNKLVLTLATTALSLVDACSDGKPICINFDVSGVRHIATGYINMLQREVSEDTYQHTFSVLTGNGMTLVTEALGDIDNVVLTEQ